MVAGPGSYVVCIDDTVGNGLPVGRIGFILAMITNPNTVYKFIVRFPHLEENWYVTGFDIMSYNHYIRMMTHAQLEISLKDTYLDIGKGPNAFYSLALEDELRRFQEAIADYE